AMASFEEQTACVVQALLSELLNDDESSCRSLETDSGEPACSAAEPPTTFDPVLVASRLRQMGDQCTLDFERVSSEAVAEVLKGKVERFGAAVDSLSRRWSDQNPGLAYERAFLCVSVKLLMHLAKKVPSLLHPSQLISVINGNSRVRSYIEAHGGWVRIE
ncbi:B2L15 protein, partial [Bucco capensis]|nr:B2L15 protein [Bucco capensis]